MDASFLTVVIMLVLSGLILLFLLNKYIYANNMLFFSFVFFWSSCTIRALFLHRVSHVISMIICVFLIFFCLLIANYHHSLLLCTPFLYYCWCLHSTAILLLLLYRILYHVLENDGKIRGLQVTRRVSVQIYRCNDYGAFRPGLLVYFVFLRERADRDRKMEDGV